MTQDTTPAGPPALPAPAAPDTTTTTSAPGPDLSALLREARTLDAAPAAAAAGESKAATALALSMETQNRGELLAALVMARDAALPLIGLASERKAVMLSAIWGDAQLEAIAKNGGAVLALHGIALSAVTGGLMPYLGLAMSLGPVAFGTYKVLSTPDPKPAEVVD